MTDKKKIILAGSAYPLRGGLAAYNERLAREYVQQGHEVIIYGFSLQYPSFLFPGKTQYSSDPAPEGLDIRVKINSVNPFNWIKTGREIKKQKADLLIIKYWLPFMAPCLGTIARIARKNKKTKVVSIVDNMIPHEHRIGDKMFSGYFVKSVDAFVAMSKSVLKDVEVFDKNKEKAFCPHPLYDHFGDPIDKKESRKALGLDENGKYVLFFGLIRDYKGLDILLKAAAKEQMKDENIKLLVAGEFYADPKPYRDLIEELDLGDRLVFHDEFIPDSKVALYFSAADIVAQPYKSATQSGVTQIAYHFDKPMLVTNVGGLSEIIPEGKVGYVTEPDETEVADALVKFYTEKKEEEFTEGAKEEKKKYSWSVMTDAISKLLEKI